MWGGSAKYAQNVGCFGKIPPYNISTRKLHNIFAKTTAFFLGLETKRHLSTTSPVPSHEQISHLILDQKSATQALQSFRWATNLPTFTHNQSTYRALIHKLCTFRRFDTVHQLLDEMPSSISSSPNDDIFITIVRGLGRARMIRQVVKVPDLVMKFKRNPCLKLLNSILDVLVKEDIEIAREFYRKKMMECGVQGDHYTFGILMKGLCLTNRIADSFKLLQLMKNQDLTPNTVIYNTLIHALCKNEKVGRARSLMNEMKEPNEVTFNVMISTYCKEENLVQALVMLEKCFNLGLVPDMVTLTKVVQILCNQGRTMEAVEVLSRVESKGVKIDVVAFNTLIKGFAGCGKTNVGLWILKEMEIKGCIPDVNTYNALISGFCESGKLDNALDMFDEMKTAGINWNFVTYDTLIRGFCLKGRINDGFKILELMEESKYGSCGRISPYNSIICGLYKENRFNEALTYLTEMGNLFPKAVNRSLSILEEEGSNSTEDSKTVYDQMKREGIVPCVLVYVSLIHRFCKEGCVREAFELMNEMIVEGYIPITSTFNPLINAFCKQGKVFSASKLLETMDERGCVLDCGSYNPLIDAFCVEKDFHKAFMFFLQMVEKGIAPNYFSWNSLVLFLSEEVFSLEGKNRISNLLDLIIENYNVSRI